MSQIYISGLLSNYIDKTEVYLIQMLQTIPNLLEYLRRFAANLLSYEQLLIVSNVGHQN